MNCKECPFNAGTKVYGEGCVTEGTQVIAVKEEDAKQMARRLAHEEGIFSGTSTGANVVAAIELAKRFKRGSKIVTVAVDTGLKYLWTEPYLENI